MSLLSRIKSWFIEDVPVQKMVVPPRGLRLSTSNIEMPEPEEVQTKLKKWVKSSLSTAPWAAVAIILFSLFVGGAVALGSLAYGLVKVAVAVLLTVIADETMFNGLKDTPDQPWLVHGRRALVFMGICWLMAVT